MVGFPAIVMLVFSGVVNSIKIFGFRLKASHLIFEAEFSRWMCSYFIVTPERNLVFFIAFIQFVCLLLGS